MITRAEWELRRKQWRVFNDWEAANPPPSPTPEDAIADVGAVYEWFPEAVRLEISDPERRGIQRMHRIFRILSQHSRRLTTSRRPKET